MLSVLHEKLPCHQPYRQKYYKLFFHLNKKKAKELHNFLQVHGNDAFIKHIIHLFSKELPFLLKKLSLPRKRR